ERVVLRFKFSAADLLDKLLDVGRDWLETQRAEHFSVQFAHLRADADAAAIGGRADRAHAVREMAKTIVPKAQHTNRQRVAHAARIWCSRNLIRTSLTASSPVEAVAEMILRRV